MTWWEWVFAWAALVSAAAWTAYVLGRSLWRKAMVLLEELSLASERLSVLSEELETLGRSLPSEEGLAVFDSPARLRRERAAARRQPGRPRQRGREPDRRGTSAGSRR